MVGDELVKSIRVNYKDSIDPAKIPQPPKKEGYNTYWEESGKAQITTNTTIHLVEALWNKDIVSVESVGDKPLLLANSYFYNGTKVNKSRGEFVLLKDKGVGNGTVAIIIVAVVGLAAVSLVYIKKKKA